METKVRDLQFDDISLVMDYWMSASPEYLHSMGADIHKMPSRANFQAMLEKQLQLSFQEKKAYALIWECDGHPIGHSNVNLIHFEESATMHLHLWKSNQRRKGLGVEFVKKSIPFYFDNLRLENLICEPYALNIAPNKTLKKVGFSFIKKYLTVPGSLNFEQEVNRWELTKKAYSTLFHK